MRLKESQMQKMFLQKNLKLSIYHIKRIYKAGLARTTRCFHSSSGKRICSTMAYLHVNFHASSIVQ